MTEHYEVVKANHNKEPIYICAWCIQEGREEPQHWLNDGHNEVKMKPTVPEYSHYSHGICKEHKEIEMIKLEAIILAKGGD